MNRGLELYLHIPFCVRKCLYCDFVSFTGKEELFEPYVNALCREIEAVSRDYTDREITSVFIGGGTPSVLPVKDIEQIVKTLYRCFQLKGTFEKRKGLFFQKIIRPPTEFTIECNPGTLDREKLKMYRKLGINRLSIGLQSTNDEDLKTLGRIHTYADFENTFEMARSVGFDNINLDLMQAIPGQNLKEWQRVMAAALTWKPEHISAYSLIVEEGTPFKRLQEEGKLNLPDEEEERAIYHYTGEFLRKTGYHRYEISNYSLPGFECRHNLGYWRRKEYLGLGLHASSMVENCRWKNTSDLNLYLTADPAQIKEEYSRLSHKEQMEEFVFLGLRCTDGISKKEFLDTFHQDFDMTFGEKIERFADMKLIENTSECVRFTQSGIDVSNHILSELLLD